MSHIAYVGAKKNDYVSLCRLAVGRIVGHFEVYLLWQNDALSEWCDYGGKPFPLLQEGEHAPYDSESARRWRAQLTIANIPLSTWGPGYIEVECSLGVRNVK